MSVEAYLSALTQELRRRFVTDRSIVDEVRGHLEDAIEAAVGQGLSREAATEQAIRRMGTPRVVAAACERDKTRVLNLCLLAVAVVAGAAIAYVDSRPSWDDAGLTAGALMIVGGALGLVGPQRPWLWALAVGIWIPAHAILETRAFAMLIVLAIPLVGAYAGWLARRWALALQSHAGPLPPLV